MDSSQSSVGTCGGTHVAGWTGLMRFLCKVHDKNHKFTKIS